MILIPSSSTSLENILSFAQKFRIYSLFVTWAILFLFIRTIFTMWKPITPIIVFQAFYSVVTFLEPIDTFVP